MLIVLYITPLQISLGIACHISYEHLSNTWYIICDIYIYIYIERERKRDRDGQIDVHRHRYEPAGRPGSRR